jgi:hypothetical protein
MKDNQKREVMQRGRNQTFDVRSLLVMSGHEVRVTVHVNSQLGLLTRWKNDLASLSVLTC